MSSNQAGFTLIELLTVVAIIGILAALGLTSFNYYKASAAYASVESTLQHARLALEGSAVDPDNPPDSVPLYEQDAQGPITNILASELLPGLMIPRNTLFQVSHDAGCDHGGCQQTFFQANHCFGKEYSRWLRFGDGLEIRLEHIAGAGCS